MVWFPPQEQCTALDAEPFILQGCHLESPELVCLQATGSNLESALERVAEKPGERPEMVPMWLEPPEAGRKVGKTWHLEHHRVFREPVSLFACGTQEEWATERNVRHPSCPKMANRGNMSK